MRTCGCSMAQPSAFQFIVKIFEGCNFFCPGCYGDWGTTVGKLAMSRDTMDLVAQRIGDHAQRYPDWPIQVLLHGGEPLLGGVEPVKYFVGQLVDKIGADRLYPSIQTNGLLLQNEHAVEELATIRPKLRIGISLDGLEESHNRFRKLRNGRGTYDLVIRGINRLRRIAPELYSGCLCVIDVTADPVETLMTMIMHAHNPEWPGGVEHPRIDFLLPHATHDLLPPGYAPGRYGRWLIDAAEWLFTMAPVQPWKMTQWGKVEVLTARATGLPLTSQEMPRVRMFDQFIRVCHGACSSSSMLLGGPVKEPLVIGHQGDWELYDAAQILGKDYVKMFWPGKPVSELNLNTGDRLTVYNTPAHVASIAAMKWNGDHGVGERWADSLPGLCDTCMNCQYLRECAGGLFVWRHSATDRPSEGLTKGFENPHLYCEDYKMLVDFFRKIHDPLGINTPPAVSWCGRNLPTPGEGQHAKA